MKVDIMQVDVKIVRKSHNSWISNKAKDSRYKTETTSISWTRFCNHELFLVSMLKLEKTWIMQMQTAMFAFSSPHTFHYPCTQSHRLRVFLIYSASMQMPLVAGTGRTCRYFSRYWCLSLSRKQISVIDNVRIQWKCDLTYMAAAISVGICVHASATTGDVCFNVLLICCIWEHCE